MLQRESHACGFICARAARRNLRALPVLHTTIPQLQFPVAAHIHLADRSMDFAELRQASEALQRGCESHGWPRTAKGRCGPHGTHRTFIIFGVLFFTLGGSACRMLFLARTAHSTQCGTRAASHKPPQVAHWLGFAGRVEASPVSMLF